MSARHRSLMLGLTALLATACGAHVPGTAHGLPAVPVVPTPMPTASVAAAPASPALALVQGARAQFEAMTSYHLVAAFFQKKGSTSAHGVYDILGKQPRTMRVEVAQGNGQGTKLLWQGGSNIQVRPSGWLSALEVTLALNDDRLISIRGYTLAQTDLHAMFGYMDNPANQATLVAPGEVDVTGPQLLAGCVRMRGHFDPASGAPKAVEFYDAHEMVYSLTIQSLERRGAVSLDI